MRFYKFKNKFCRNETEICKWILIYFTDLLTIVKNFISQKLLVDILVDKITWSFYFFFLEFYVNYMLFYVNLFYEEEILYCSKVIQLQFYSYTES